MPSIISIRIHERNKWRQTDERCLDWNFNATSREEIRKAPNTKTTLYTGTNHRSFNQKGALILDPFCGSSSTGVAAKKLGRKYIGIDSETIFIELSKRRLQGVIVNENLF